MVKGKEPKGRVVDIVFHLREKEMHALLRL